MTDKDNVPEKLDLAEILEGDDSDDMGQVEVLDPVTGKPAGRPLDIDDEDAGDGGIQDAFSLEDAPGPAGAPPPGGSGEALERALAEKERFEELLVRTRADFENFRKRTERDREQEVSLAAGRLVRELLPALDNLERALESAPAGDPFVQGVALIQKQLHESLSRAGLQPIEAVGELFDPVFHEAVCTEDTEAFESNRVVAQIQTGYLFRGRVLRPSLVKVSVRSEAAGRPGFDPAGNDEL